MSLAPSSFLAMQGEHYPITEIGLANLCRQLIKRGEAAGDPSQVQVRRYRKARINDRACTHAGSHVSVHDEKNWGYLARIFVDNAVAVPHARRKCTRCRWTASKIRSLWKSIPIST